MRIRNRGWVRVASLCALLILSSLTAACLLSTTHTITTGRYYLADDLAKGGPDSATTYFDFWVAQGTHNELHHYKVVEYSTPGCIRYWHAGFWGVKGKEPNSSLDFNQTSYDFATAPACVTDTTVGRWSESSVSYKVRTITATSFEACYYRDANLTTVSQCDPKSPDWNLYTLLEDP